MVDEQTLGIRAQQVLHDKKWQKFLPRAGVFRYLPFVEFAFAAGSLAMGNVREDSDFDVIVKTDSGRLYASRFFCLLLFSLLGWRRTFDNPKDGFCFNCFVAGDKQLILEPYNQYGRQLSDGLMRIEVSQNYMVKNFERLFAGQFGTLLEIFLKNWQLKRINQNLQKFKLNSNSRIIINDNRVEVCLSLKDILD